MSSEKLDVSIKINNDSQVNKRITSELSKINLCIPKLNLNPIVTKGIEEGLNKAKESINSVQKVILSVRENKIHFYESISKMFTYLSTPYSFYDYFKSISKSLELLKEADKKYIEFSAILLNYGWTPTTHISYKTISQVVEIYSNDSLNEKDKRRLITKKIINAYDNAVLYTILEGWKKNLLLSNRIKILNDVIEAHLSRKYNLSLPILISQLEGVIAKAFYHKGELHEPRYRAYLNETMTIFDDSYFDNSAINFFINVLMIEFQHGKKILPLSSRHAILHGADVKYGTRENSLKMILLFDYIQDKFSFFSRDNSNIYHVVGCNKVPAIERKEEKNIDSSSISYYFVINNKGKRSYFKKKLSFYNSLDDLRIKNLRPCKICIKNI
jgi:hypothetical protein